MVTARLGRSRPNTPIVLRLPLSATVGTADITGTGTGAGTVTASRTDTADVTGAGTGAGSITAATQATARPSIFVISNPGILGYRPPSDPATIVIGPIQLTGNADVTGLGTGVATVTAARTDTGAVTGTGTGVGTISATRVDIADVAGDGVGAGVVAATGAGPPTRPPLIVVDPGTSYRAARGPSRPIQIRGPAVVPPDTAFVTGVGTGQGTVTATRTDLGDVTGVGGGVATVTVVRVDAADLTGPGAGAGIVTAARVDTATLTGVGAGAGTVAATRTDTADVTGAGTGAGVVTAILVGTVTGDVAGVGLGASTVTATATSPAAGSWDSLIGIMAEWRNIARDEATRTPVACPNDGTPLTAGPDGGLFCPFDGWRPG